MPPPPNTTPMEPIKEPKAPPAIALPIPTCLATLFVKVITISLPISIAPALTPKEIAAAPNATSATPIATWCLSAHSLAYCNKRSTLSISSSFISITLFIFFSPRPCFLFWEQPEIGHKKSRTLPRVAMEVRPRTCYKHTKEHPARLLDTMIPWSVGTFRLCL